MKAKRLWIPILIVTLALSVLFNSTDIESRASEVMSGEPDQIDREPPSEATKDTRQRSRALPTTDNSETIAAFVVPFPDDEPVGIRIRKPPEDRHAYPDELMTNFEYYRQLARDGDNEVSVKLGNAFRSCELLAADSEEALDEAINQLYQTRTWPLKGDHSLDLATDQDLHQSAANLESLSRNCWLVTDVDRVEAFAWIEAAANNDYLPALHELASKQLGTDVHFATVERMWELGNIHALHQMARAYRGGRGVEQSTVKGYAYDYLHSHIKTIDHEIHGNGGYVARTSNRLEYLRNYESRLRDYQIKEGRRLAREILMSNASCCVSWYRVEP